MIVELNQCIYEMNGKQFIELVKAAKKTFDCYAIVSVEKDGLATMTKDAYENLDSLKEAIKEYKSNGFKVYYTVPKRGKREKS